MATVFWVFFRRHLFSPNDVYLLAGDEVVITKADFRYPESPIRPVEQIPAGISLSVDDLYLYNEQFTLIPEIINVDSEILQRTNNFGGLSAIITPVNTNAEQEELELDLQQQQDKQYQLTIQPNKLQPGLYRLKVETNIAHTDAPNPVHDLFVISE